MFISILSLFTGKLAAKSNKSLFGMLIALEIVAYRQSI